MESQKEAEERAKQKEERMVFDRWKNELIEKKLNELGHNEAEKLMQDFIETIKSNSLFSKMYDAK